MHFKRLYIFAFLLLLLITKNSFSQDKSNKGKEFWLGYGHNVLFTQDPPVNSQTLVLYLSAEQAANVTVSVNGTTWSQTVSIPANTVDFSVTIPKSGANDARIQSEGLSARGIHIVSDVPIVAYAHQYGLLSSGATMLMPVETYGYTYYSLNYTQVSNYVDSYSWFYVVASEDNTRLEITPSDSTQGGWEPNITYTVNLNKGEIYNVFGKRTGNLTSKDMTGSKIVSISGNDGNCHPIGVFSGSSRITICNGNGGEFLQQQIFPANAWGTKYVTFHSVNNTSGTITTPFLNIYRVAVRNPSTVVKRNGVVMTGLVNNFYYEFQSSSGDFIEADQPVLVAQYTGSSNECTGSNPNPLGDPEMFYLSPIEQGVKSAIFYNTRNQVITLNFVNIITPVTAIPSLQIDGNPVLASEFIVHPTNPAYAVVVKRLLGAAAQHSITCDSTFIATNYGVGTLESYGYNVGTLVNNLNAYSEIKNTFNTSGNIDTFTCPKTPVRLFVKLAYPATQIHWKLSQVTGITPNVDSIINSPVPLSTQSINGRTYYTYTLQQDFVFANAGTYLIPVTYTAPDIDACNQTETTTIKVVVKPGPISDFAFTAPSCLSDSVYFTGTPSANGFNLINYNWLFDDNTTSSTINTVKLFSGSTTQSVRFRVYADNGCAGDTTKIVTLFEKPTAVFGISGNICEKDSIRITDNSTIGAGSITSWQWDFGDGNTTTLSNNSPFYHQYITPGNYTISLITFSNNGCKSDTSFVPVTVNERPTATFAYSGNICLGDSVLFSDNSIPNSGTILSWQWNFGDGNSAIYANNNPFYHTYGSSGNFPVTLVVTGSNTCISDTFRLTVNVSSQPSATFIISGKPCIDSLQIFTSSLSAGGSNPPTFNWNFGDGQSFSSATSNSTAHAYSALQSNVIVRHWISYSGGCSSDTTFNTIPVINANPVANFTLDQTVLCEKQSILFTSTSTGVGTWNWDFGNGSGNNVPPFNRSYNSPGNFTVSLNMLTADGCGSLPASKLIVINANPVVDAGPDKLIKFGTSTTLDATINNPGNYNFVWTPSLYLTSSTILNPITTPTVPVNYSIQAIDKLTGCIGNDGVLITPVSDIYVPTGFTPNNDGRNDKWVIPGLALYPEAKVSVYNRWGEKVYEANNYYSNPWNGFYKGIKQPVGVYIYVIQLDSDASKIIKGTVTLIL